MRSESIKHSIINGIVSAQNQFESLSGQWLCDRGVESFMSVNVAQRLKENISIDPGKVLVEVTFKELFERYLKKFQGNPGIFSNARSRADIVILDENDNAFGVVELKRSAWVSGWEADIARVEAFARRSSTIQHKPFGAFAAFVAEKEGDEKIQSTFEEMKEICECYSHDPDLIFQKSRFRESWGARWRYAVVGCVMA